MRSSILTASAKLWLLRPSYGCFGQAMAASAHGCFSLFESNSYDFKIYGNPSLIHLFVACTNQTCCRYLESSFAQEKKCVDRWLKLFSCCWKTWHCHCRHTHALKFEHTPIWYFTHGDISTPFGLYASFSFIPFTNTFLKEAVYSTFLFLFLVSVTFSCK